jgi:hypothetical protein
MICKYNGGWNYKKKIHFQKPSKIKKVAIKKW